MADNAKPFKYEWFVLGDINGFFGLMFDNMTVLSFMAGILVFAFGFPAEIVYKKMFPGTAFGVLFGDIVYTWMAFRLAKRTGNPKVTAMPLGLDTPSTIGITLAVLGPAFLGFKANLLGLLPPGADFVTTFSAGRCTNSTRAEAVTAWLRFAAGPAADAIQRRHGMEPAR